MCQAHVFLCGRRHRSLSRSHLTPPTPPWTGPPTPVALLGLDHPLLLHLEWLLLLLLMQLAPTCLFLLALLPLTDKLRMSF